MRAHVLGGGDYSLALLSVFPQVGIFKLKLGFRHSSHIGLFCPRRGDFEKEDILGNGIYFMYNACKEHAFMKGGCYAGFASSRFPR